MAPQNVPGNLPDKCRPGFLQRTQTVTERVGLTGVTVGGGLQGSGEVPGCGLAGLVSVVWLVFHRRHSGRCSVGEEMLFTG